MVAIKPINVGDEIYVKYFLDEEKEEVQQTGSGSNKKQTEVAKEQGDVKKSATRKRPRFM